MQVDNAIVSFDTTSNYKCAIITMQYTKTTDTATN